MKQGSGGGAGQARRSEQSRGDGRSMGEAEATELGWKEGRGLVP